MIFLTKGANRRKGTQAIGRWTAFVALFGLALSMAAVAQSGIGSIQGTVTDSTGAVIPGATVHILNKATGVASATTSNSVGFYQVPGLLAGPYEVSVTSRDMKTSTESIELLVAQNAVVDIKLQPGAVTQQVEVSSNSVQLVTTDNGELTSTLENQRINQLPMNGRDIINLVNETTPGLESCPESGSCANGQMGPAMEYEVDGATLTNREFGGVHAGQSQMIDPDSVQEVRVEDNSAGAEYAAPATVILNTKSGTNQLHGSFFETARNNAFGIARNRQDQSNYVAPEYIRNEFGGSVGGPIVFPHLYHGKNKSFFFFAYERYSLAQVASQNEMTPTTAMRSGDFSGLTNSAGVLQELYDPATTQSSASCAEPASAGAATPADTWCRTPFMSSTGELNVIPSNRESPTAKILNDITPLPTNSENPAAGGNNLSGLDPEYQVTPQITFRLDQDFNENNRAYLRYSQVLSTSISPRNDPVDESYTLAADGLPAGASGIASTPTNVYSPSIGYTHVFSPTFFAESIFSMTFFGEHNYAGGQPTLDYESKLGLPNNFGEPGFPYVESIFQPLDGTQFQYSMTTNTRQFDENMTKILGRHQLLFGGRIRFEHMGLLPDQNKDEVNFKSGEATGLENPTSSNASPSAYTNSGQLNADEFIGGASSYNVNLEPPYQHIHDWEIDAYLQDNYRIRNNLTLNLGLRYEAHPAAWVGEGDMTGFDLKNDALVTSAPTSTLIAEGLTTQAIINNDTYDGVKFESPAQAGMPSMLIKSYNLNFAPRIGAAWQPFGKWGTVLRGGVGRYIYPIPVRETYKQEAHNNPLTASYTEDFTNAEYAPDSLPNYILRSAPNTGAWTYSQTGWPVMGSNSTNAVNSSTTTAIVPGISLVSFDPNYKPTFVNEGDFVVEQPTKWNSMVRIAYIYTHGTNLNNYFFYNTHPSEYDWEVQTGTAPPTGNTVGPTNANTGQGPYDQVTWGSGSYQVQKTGWSNYNALQAEFEKLYHNGSAWQVMYVWSKSMRTGGDFGGEDAEEVTPYSSYVNSGAANVSVTPIGNNPPINGLLPPPPPAGVPVWGYYKALNRFENYMEDTNNPPFHLQFNGLIDLPFGKDKRFLSNSNRAMNELVGGWQLAGAGGFTVTDFQVNLSSSTDKTNWGPTSALQVYRKHQITDCRSGVCLKSYEWFNGYIPPTNLPNNTCSAGLSTTVSGLPTNWAPYQEPMDTICSAPAGGKAVVDKYYGDNDVTMNNVTGQKANSEITYAPNPGNNDSGPTEHPIEPSNPYGHTVINGPLNWDADLSLFKVFPITERMVLRVNVDAFNAFNIQGLPNPNGSDGTVCYTPGGLGCSSQNTPRQLQFTARLTF